MSPQSLNHQFVFGVIISFLITSDGSQASSCAQECYINVDCVNLELQAVPTACKTVINLKLDNNTLLNLHIASFEGFSRLKTLSITSNQIATIMPGTFLPCQSTLQKVDLATNKLTILVTGIFANLTALREIDLSNNELYSIQNYAFQDLENVEQIFLENPQLFYISRLAFVNVGVQHLVLSYNNLKC